MALISISEDSLFCVGDKVTINGMTTMWPEWARKFRYFWRFRLVRKVLDWKYPPRHTTQDFTITGISENTLEI